MEVDVRVNNGRFVIGQPSEGKWMDIRGRLHRTLTESTDGDDGRWQVQQVEIGSFMLRSHLTAAARNFGL